MESITKRKAVGWIFASIFTPLGIIYSSLAFGMAHSDRVVITLLHGLNNNQAVGYPALFTKGRDYDTA